MLVISAWLARRVGRRIDAVRGLFARIADGSFEQAAAERGGWLDEDVAGRF